MMHSVTVMFGQTTTKTAIATAIFLQQDIEMSSRWKCIITQNFLDSDVVYCAICETYQFS